MIYVIYVIYAIAKFTYSNVSNNKNKISIIIMCQQKLHFISLCPPVLLPPIYIYTFPYSVQGLPLPLITLLSPLPQITTLSKPNGGNDITSHEPRRYITSHRIIEFQNSSRRPALSFAVLIAGHRLEYCMNWTRWHAGSTELTLPRRELCAIPSSQDVPCLSQVSRVTVYQLSATPIDLSW